MFNWFKKSAVVEKVASESEVAAIQNGGSITPFAMSESEALKNQGNVHFGNGKLEEAAEYYRRAIALNPRYAEACNNLGFVLQAQGNLDEAVALYRKAVEFDPNLMRAHQNLGFALMSLGQSDAAEESLRRVVALAPEHAAALQSLGVIAAQRGDFAHAETLLRRALELQPDCAEAHYNLGTLLMEAKRRPEAEASFRRALEIKPDYAEAHYNLGILLMETKRLPEAEASFRRASEISPDFAYAHSNLGVALKDLGQLDDAVASFRRALEINPDYANAHNNLGLALTDLGQLDNAMASYQRALVINPDLAVAHSNLLFTHNYLSDQPATMSLEEAQRFGDLAARQARPFTNWRNVPETGRCLRVGLVSGDLRDHPVGYFVESILAALTSTASGRLELIAYYNHSRIDALAERIKVSCHDWHSAVGLSDESLARQIRDDGIDILIDLSGHTAHNRLTMFAWKPAPVQVSWLGYFATTGVAAIDYFIADPWTLPEAEEIYFTEKIWRLPETRLCFTAPDVEVQVAPLPALANNYITFGCFNSLAKMNDTVVALWGRVLASVPNSRLFLKAKQLDEASVRQNTVERFAAFGVAGDRLILEGHSSRAEYLAAYNRVDIALDPFPFTGGTTSAEGLWMGVPVLTLEGEHFLSRQGIGLLMNVGLPSWIAADEDDYVARAVSHASDLQGLAALRNGLREQVLASPLFDAPRFARHFEAAMRGMWQEWCDGFTKI